MLVLIVEDSPEARKWLCDQVKVAFPEAVMTITDSVATGRAALTKTEFDMALIDLGLPDGTGLELLRQIKGHPMTLAIVTTVIADDSMVVAALAAGAQGYLLKETLPEVMVQQLRQARSGQPALSPAIARRLMTHFRRTGPVAEATHSLTPRETQVLTLIAQGFRNSEVAEALGITSTTVGGYIKDIYRKLGISSRAEATFEATRFGLLTDGQHDAQ